MLNMEKIDKKGIEEACEDLKSALLETINLDEQMFNLVQLQKKVRYRLNKSREILNFIKI